MRQLDKNLPQDVEGIRSNDRCVEISKGHNEDCSRSKHNNHRDGRYDSES